MNDKKSILITGAGSGLGRETAKLFAKRGWVVGIFDLNEESVKKLKDELAPAPSLCGTMDVTDLESVKKGIDNFAAYAGKIDVLFNNAGILQFGMLDETDLSFNNKVINVNINGVLNCSYYALKYLKKSSDAKIINMASSSALYGIPELTAYSASKRAVCAITEALNLEFERYGIWVGDVVAPFIKTPMIANSDEQYVIKKMGVNLSAADVAEAVWKAAHTRKIHRIVSSSVKLINFIFLVFPYLKRTIVKNKALDPKYGL